MIHLFGLFGNVVAILTFVLVFGGGRIRRLPVFFLGRPRLLGLVDIEIVSVLPRVREHFVGDADRMPKGVGQQHVARVRTVDEHEGLPRNPLDQFRLLLPVLVLVAGSFQHHVVVEPGAVVGVRRPTGDLDFRPVAGFRELEIPQREVRVFPLRSFEGRI